MPFRSCAIRKSSDVFPVDLLAAVFLESYAEAWAKRLDEPFAAARYRPCKRTISWTRTRWKIRSTTWHITIWAAGQISALHLSNSTARSCTKVYWEKISCRFSKQGKRNMGLPVKTLVRWLPIDSFYLENQENLQTMSKSCFLKCTIQHQKILRKNPMPSSLSNP